MITREASSDVVLLALSPIVIVAAERSLVLLPVLLLPVLAVYRSALLSAEKEHQAMHDALTDLPNRLQFSEVIERRFENARSKSTQRRRVADRPRSLQGGQRHARSSDR